MIDGKSNSSRKSARLISNFWRTHVSGQIPFFVFRMNSFRTWDIFMLDILSWMIFPPESRSVKAKATVKTILNKEVLCIFVVWKQIVMLIEFWGLLYLRKVILAPIGGKELRDSLLRIRQILIYRIKHSFWTIVTILEFSCNSNIINIKFNSHGP